MKKIINWLLFPNWKIVTVDCAHSNVRRLGVTQKEISVYVIMHSENRRKYKLKTSGYKPKKHPYYVLALNQLSKFQNGIIQLKRDYMECYHE